MAKLIKERFLEKVNKQSGKYCNQLGTECWEWLAAKDLAGYGIFGLKLTTRKSKNCRAHKASYILFVSEEFTDNTIFCHSCDWPSCVNPEHIFCGTPQSNMTDKKNKGRAKGQAAGSEHSLAKLKDADILEIFELNYKGHTTVQISRIFGVDQSAISLILSGKRWAHIETPYRYRVKNNNRFTDEDIRDIFIDYSTIKTYTKVAQKWGTVPSVVYNIIKRNKYSHVQLPSKLTKAVSKGI